MQIQTIDDEIVDWEKNNIQIKPENWQSIKDYVKKLKKMDLVQLGKEKSSLPVQDVRIAVVDMVIRRNGIDDGAKYFENIRKINNVFLPSTRTAKQQYPIAPRELLSTFLPELIWLIANDAREASRTTIIRSLDVRNYLRHTLEMSYDVMTHRTEMVDKDPWDPARVQNPVLADGPFMSGLLELIHQRDFPTLTSSPQDYGRDPAKVSQAARPAGLRAEYNELVKGILKCYRNVGITTLGPLCFAIALDAALLDEALRNDAIKVFRKKGLPSEPLEGIHFYYPPSVPNDEAKAVFSDYVRYRWPIITFALDPVTDQQNIADSFNLKRDLQLAVSFAFATGQINFSQLNTFRRQIEQSSDTIALNRTVTGFVHGEDNFGFRFTPRFQNPPNQRTNIGVIVSQLISGGPGPDYQIRKSKLEPGIRELTAVLLIPTFLSEMRMNVVSNWFKLNDPEHLVFHTKRMMERGRRVQELRQAAVDACSTQQYRDADLRVLQSKLDQLDVMLPMQSRVIQLPFDNSASGFDLFSEGSAALVPELTGFSGVDVVTLPAASSGAAATSGGAASGGGAATGAAGATGGTTAASPTTAATTLPATFSITSLSTPANTATATYTLTGGTTSIADIFIFGKYISLLDTRVIAGGKSASFEILSREVVHVQIPANVISTTTDDNKTYIEVYLATPNGISNSLLVPCIPTKPPVQPPVGYDVATASQSINVFYQWLTLPDGTHQLVVTADPGKKGIGITWDDSIGLAPRQIQAQFVATINNQNLVMVFQAKAGNKDDYFIDAQQFAVTLLKRLQDMTVYPALPQSPIQFTVNVQPWLPADSEGLRKTTAKALKSNVTVTLQYNDTGVNALPGVGPVKSPPPAPDNMTTSGLSLPGAAVADDRRLAGMRATSDPALIRTAQQLQLPSPSSFLSATQPPPVLNTPALLAPNVSSEAEQISKMLTGQPVATRVSIPGDSSATAGATNFAAAAGSVATQATGQLPTIVVNPSPVVLIPSSSAPAKKKRTSRVHQMINRLGNRASQAMPQ